MLVIIPPIVAVTILMSFIYLWGGPSDNSEAIRTTLASNMRLYSKVVDEQLSAASYPVGQHQIDMPAPFDSMTAYGVEVLPAQPGQASGPKFLVIWPLDYGNPALSGWQDGELRAAAAELREKAPAGFGAGFWASGSPVIELGSGVSLPTAVVSVLQASIPDGAPVIARKIQ